MWLSGKLRSLIFALQQNPNATVQKTRESLFTALSVAQLKAGLDALRAQICQALWNTAGRTNLSETIFIFVFPEMFFTLKSQKMPNSKATKSPNCLEKKPWKIHHKRDMDQAKDDASLRAITVFWF